MVSVYGRFYCNKNECNKHECNKHECNKMNVKIVVKIHVVDEHR